MNPMNKDSNLEDALRNALQREDAPEAFAANVLARAAQKDSVASEKISWFRLFSLPVVRWVSPVTISICLIAGGIYYRDLQRERAQGEAAKQRLMLALRIAGNKLQLAKTKVNEINQSRPEHQSDAKSPRSRS
jgi:hypothetical protein